MLANLTLPLVPGMNGQHVGWVVYALACLEMADCTALTEALVKRAEGLFVAQLRSAARTGGGVDENSVDENPPLDRDQLGKGKSNMVAGDRGVLVAADYANIAWGLGTLQFRPPAAWMDAFCRYAWEGL